MVEARSLYRDTRVNIHGGDWEYFIDQIGFDPLERNDGSFVPVDTLFFGMIKVEYRIVRKLTPLFEGRMVYQSRTTFIWWH